MSTAPSPRPGQRERVAVVGGGILGVAVARQLLTVRPELDVTVLEKEDRLAAHQTGRNSGVVHAGIYYPPGSLKAQLCRRGVGLLRSFCSSHGIAYDACGKLIVALDAAESARLAGLQARAVANGVPGVQLLGPEAMREIEPHVRGVAGLHSPETAIVDFAAVTRALAVSLAARGGSVELGAEVVGLSPRRDEVVVRTSLGEAAYSGVIVCAGLQSDRLARLAGDGDDPRIVPFRGSYALLRPERRSLVRSLIYPVPDPRYPFLGVHLTRRHDGEVLVGPNAVLALAREGYRGGDVVWRDARDTMRWPGFRRLARQHWRTGLAELHGAMSRRAFVRQAARYVPELRVGDVVPGPAGVRAQAVARDGSLVDDFRISRCGRVTAVRNAPSPGATSSLAIAEYIVERYLAD